MAKDLVKKLFVYEPEKRLGAGKQGSKNDFKALKKHAFFDGVNFSDMNLQ